MFTLIRSLQYDPTNYYMPFLIWWDYNVLGVTIKDVKAFLGGSPKVRVNLYEGDKIIFFSSKIVFGDKYHMRSAISDKNYSAFYFILVVTPLEASRGTCGGESRI